MINVVTALEHEDLPVDEQTANGIRPHEVAHLTAISERCRGFCQVGNGRIRLSRYVGLTRIGERLLEVLPKAEGSDACEEACRGTLLRLLGLGRRITIHSEGSAEHALRNRPLLETFIEIYFREVSALQRGGLIRRYQRMEEDLGLIRGRLMLQRQVARHGMRPDRLACAFDELTPDNDWNRVLKAALVASRSWLNRMVLRRRWSELYAGFDEVGLPMNPRDALGELSPDRQSRRYGEAVRWARWIIEHLSPNLRAGGSTAPSMLFDMSVLFEEAIAAHLMRELQHVAPLWSLRTQERGEHLARSLDSGRESVGLKPDLILQGPARRQIIADTKWKRPAVTRGELTPDVGDVHQMLAYAAAYRCDRLVLIYPWAPEQEQVSRTRLQLPEVAGVTPVLELASVDVGADTLPLRVGGDASLAGLLTAS